MLLGCFWLFILLLPHESQAGRFPWASPLSAGSGSSPGWMPGTLGCWFDLGQLLWSSGCSPKNREIFIFFRTQRAWVLKGIFDRSPIYSFIWLGRLQWNRFLYISLSVIWLRLWLLINTPGLFSIPSTCNSGKLLPAWDCTFFISVQGTRVLILLPFHQFASELLTLIYSSFVK